MYFNRDKPRKKSKLVYLFIKRAIDILGATFGILIFSPVMLIIAILIKLDSKGPIIHRRESLGQYGENFPMYKFRTMVTNANEQINRWKKTNPSKYQEYKRNIKLESDPRVTSIGKVLRRYGLDETPQFFNVLKGEMSLVGPRPIVQQEKEKFSRNILNKRFKVKPGITGYWQVNGKNEVDYDERIEMDNYYLEHQSLWLDFMIMLETIWIFFIKGKNQ